MTQDAASKILTIFNRKGSEGAYVKIFHNMSQVEKARLKDCLQLVEEDIGLIGGVWGQICFLLADNELIYRDGRDIRRIGYRDIDAVGVDVELAKLHPRRLGGADVLEIYTVGGEKHYLNLEPGLPFMGIWSVLLNLAKSKDTRHRPSR